MPKKTASLVLPDWLDAELWAEFVKHRKALKKPMTDYAQALAFKILERFRNAGHEPRGVIEQSIFNGWQGLFEPRQQTGNRQQAQERRNAQVGEDWADRMAQREEGRGDAVH